MSSKVTAVQVTGERNGEYRYGQHEKVYMVESWVEYEGGDESPVYNSFRTQEEANAYGDTVAAENGLTVDRIE